jgi:hypothetical protein
MKKTMGNRKRSAHGHDLEGLPYADRSLPQADGLKKPRQKVKLKKQGNADRKTISSS